MALTEDGGVGMTMPVSPMYGGGNGFGFGGDWAWIILLLLLGWGNNGWGGNGGYGNGAGFVDASVQRGFDQSAIMSSLGDIQGAICNGFAGVEASANARQIADMFHDGRFELCKTISAIGLTDRLLKRRPDFHLCRQDITHARHRLFIKCHKISSSGSDPGKPESLFL